MSDSVSSGRFNERVVAAGTLPDSITAKRAVMSVRAEASMVANGAG